MPLDKAILAGFGPKWVDLDMAVAGFHGGLRSNADPRGPKSKKPRQITAFSHGDHCIDRDNELINATRDGVFLRHGRRTGDNQQFPALVINFIQTRILITHHGWCRAGHRKALRKPVSVLPAQCDGGGDSWLRKLRSGPRRKRYAFEHARTVWNCADECDPDENWIEEALVTLERAGLRGLVDGQKVAFDTQ